VNTLSVALDALDVIDRLRAVDAKDVARLAVSMADVVGQLTPIEVTHEAGRYRLVSGAHRVAAARQLGWERIAAVLVEGSPDELRLHEIDENLKRRELSPYDHSTFIFERVEVCQRLGIIPKEAGRRNSANLALKTFAEEIAGKFGISRRLTFMSLRRRRNIDGAVWRQIAGTWLADNGAQLDQLTRLQPDEQASVVSLLLGDGDERPKKVAQALKRVRGVADLPSDRHAEAASKLLSQYLRLPAKQRRWVWSEIQKDNR